MFSGFTDETIQFFLDLKFHNSTEYFHAQHERYLSDVQKPFYEMITDLSPCMLRIDPLMETRPYKCLSHIHRDTRFSKDKSPYRDHLWFLFRRAGEPREKSLMYYFEFGPSVLGWGLGFWGENREVLDHFRRRMQAHPMGISALVNDLNPEKCGLFLGGTVHKRISIPENIPTHLKRWYCIREMYIGKMSPDYGIAFSDQVLREVRKDFESLAPLYQLLRGICDDIVSE